VSERKNDRKKLWKYDWCGDCDPNGKNSFPHGETFSVGIRQWIPGRTRPMIRGPVCLRIKGNPSYPKPVYEAAESWCDRMDKGEMPDFKMLNMGFHN
jgi:hypothetical protein